LMRSARPAGLTPRGAAPHAAAIVED